MVITYDVIVHLMISRIEHTFVAFRILMEISEVMLFIGVRK